MTIAPPERVIRLPGGRRIFYDRLSKAERAQADVELAELDRLLERNPIQGFDAHSDAQQEFIAARTRIVAAIAGNRFGKTTSLVIKALIECLPREALPERLAAHKRFGERVDGWIMVPTEEKVFDSLKPAFEKWVGAEFFKGGSWGKAFNAERMQLTFANPFKGGCNWSTIGFKTYKQDESTLGGASLWFVGYDEPPPKGHREEGRTRVIDHGGFEMFAFTPITTNVAYAKRIIYNRREHPDITLVRGSIHDNTVLPPDAIAAWRAEFLDDPLLRAREFGDFVDVGGQIWPQLEHRLVEPWDPADEQARKAGRFADVVVSIDPGVRNCGITFIDFDSHNVGTVFDERLLQDSDVEDYDREIRAKLAHWGIPLARVDFRIDPKTGVARSQIDKQSSVRSALAALGIGCTLGENAVEAGITQVRGRLRYERLWICRNCVLLRAEADDYVGKPRDDGVFEVLKQSDHLCDSLRYGCMARPFYPAYELAAPCRNLGAPVFRPGHALPASQLVTTPDSPPLGFMS